MDLKKVIKQIKNNQVLEKNDFLRVNTKLWESQSNKNLKKLSHNLVIKILIKFNFKNYLRFL